MEKLDKFLIYKKPYAIDLSTIEGSFTRHHDQSRVSFHGSARAVWYRRKEGVTRACLGSVNLFTFSLEPTCPLNLDDPESLLLANLDGRYGGNCEGRWDGQGYWGSEDPDVMAEHLAILKPMLEEIPSAPEGFDGWYRFTD